MMVTNVEVRTQTMLRFRSTKLRSGHMTRER